MPSDPWYIALLDKLGVNTTKLRWKLYRKEQQANNLVHTGGPAAFDWLKYPNKICGSCRSVNDRDARICDSCGKRLPSMTGYRARRLVQTIVPSEGPVVSMTFLGLIVIVYVTQNVLDTQTDGGLMGPSREALYTLGAFTATLAVTFEEYWRFLSFGLLHGGLIHFACIAYALFQIGPMLEMQIGRNRMLGLITLTQLTAAFGTYFWYTLMKGMPGVLTVGGSGWLYGLLGFGVAYFHQMGPGGRPIRDSLLRWALIWLVLGMMIPGINNAAHIGGMLGGLVYAMIPEGNARHQVRANGAWNLVFWVSALAWAMTLFFMIRSIFVLWPQLTG